MRAVTFLASLLLALSVAAPSFAAPNSNAKNAQTKKRAQSAKPTWEQCYAMSRQRGFDHEHDEWLQSIQDCMDGKIPL